MLAPREAALVGAYPLVERTQGLRDNNVVLVTVEDSRNSRRLRFCNCGDFFDDHALSFALSASTARGQSNHPQRHDALGVDAELRSLKCYLDPGVEQVRPFAGKEYRWTSRCTLVRRTVWANLFFAGLRVCLSRVNE